MINELFTLVMDYLRSSLGIVQISRIQDKTPILFVIKNNNNDIKQMEKYTTYHRNNAFITILNKLKITDIYCNYFCKKLKLRKHSCMYIYSNNNLYISKCIETKFEKFFKQNIHKYLNPITPQTVVFVNVCTISNRSHYFLLSNIEHNYQTRPSIPTPKSIIINLVDISINKNNSLILSPFIKSNGLRAMITYDPDVFHRTYSQKWCDEINVEYGRSAYDFDCISTAYQMVIEYLYVFYNISRDIGKIVASYLKVSICTYRYAWNYQYVYELNNRLFIL